MRLQKSESAQSVKFIPSVFTCDKISLKDEQTNTSTDYTATFTQEKYWLEAEIILSLELNRFYEITAYNGSDVVYKGKAFCTNQSDYSINNGIYTSHSTTNEFIVR